MIIIAMVVYSLKIMTILFHDWPTQAPRTTSSVFQIALPIVVRRQNFPNEVCAIPAGIEIKLRITGMQRP